MLSRFIFEGGEKSRPDFKNTQVIKIRPGKKSWGEKKTWGEKWGVKIFFLGSACNHRGMIDYSLTFTKRGRKPYFSLISKEL